MRHRRYLVLLVLAGCSTQQEPRGACGESFCLPASAKLVAKVQAAVRGRGDFRICIRRLSRVGSFIRVALDLELLHLDVPTVTSVRKNVFVFQWLRVRGSIPLGSTCCTSKPPSVALPTEHPTTQKRSDCCERRAYNSRLLRRLIFRSPQETLTSGGLNERSKIRARANGYRAKARAGQ